ncbi:transporter [Erwinia tracheiphila PSU-1]|nr:transporter [Erwinia tracheiphila PSU-1]
MFDNSAQARPDDPLPRGALATMDCRLWLLYAVAGHHHCKYCPALNGESLLHMHTVVVAYVLTVDIMLPVSGWLADHFGVRTVFFSAIVLFSVGSLFCVQATTLNQLIAARVIQGFGGTMMVPVGRLTVMKTVPREQYMAAMTFVTLPGQVGPLLGGVLVQYASWHWIFLIILPVGLAVATLLLLPNLKLPPRHFDFTGFILLAAGMSALMMALDGMKGLNFSPLLPWLPAASPRCLLICCMPAATGRRCSA